MGIRVYKTHTPSTRSLSVCTFAQLTKTKPQSHLTRFWMKQKGKNNYGKITIKHRGGGHKRLYRSIDFKRTKYAISSQVSSIEYDPNRSAFVALLHYQDGEKRYILHPTGLQIGDTIQSGVFAPIDIGNSLPITQIPLGMQIHNIELHPGHGGQLVKSAGTSAQILSKQKNIVTIRLPSGEIRSILNKCWATIGQVGNSEWNQIRLGKAGRKRWYDRRPHVRGIAMNPIDHPHGGGEGRSPIGRTYPATPWGQPALGKKTRKSEKYSDTCIIARRK